MLETIDPNRMECFYLQALDNQSPDIVRIGDHEPRRSETWQIDRLRELAVKRITDVTGYGRKVFSSKDEIVEIWWRKLDLVISVTSSTLDNNGRNARVFYCNRVLESCISADKSEMITGKVLAFGMAHGLVFIEGLSDQIAEGLAAVKKTIPRYLLNKMIILIVIMFLGMLAIRLIV
ncbi:MAG: hypothetical protein PHO08_17985 [Methylococcales bacterium]|nr:hypothetical protein [Methylococcales bacterium]MDD5632007.1 hypothetical protein [Methylococcales bacterium]